MADTAGFPQIPGRVWWGVRDLLHKTPSIKIDERLLTVELSVQPVAARQYVGELRRAGIIDDDGRASDIARKWRLDDKYNEAVAELVARIYPEGLLHAAPPRGGDRDKAVSWFMQEGLGRGSASNKAATYFLIGSPTPNEAPPRASSFASRATNRPRPRNPANSQNAPSRGTDDPARRRPQSGNLEWTPLNINIQIHISADASSDQIDAIFSAMRRHLHDGTAN